MSERRNFPANSKDVAKKDNVDRGTVDSFAFMLDYLSLKIDDNLRIVKNVPYTLAGVGVVLLLWRSNSLRRLKGISAVPQRVYRENARLPVKVVEVNETSIGVVHMPMLYRVFGRGQHHDESNVMHIRLSGVQFPERLFNLPLDRSSSGTSNTSASEPTPPSPATSASSSSSSEPTPSSRATDSATPEPTSRSVATDSVPPEPTPLSATTDSALPEPPIRPSPDSDSPVAPKEFVQPAIPTETKSSTTTEDAEKKPSSTLDSALPEPPIRPSPDSGSPVAPKEFVQPAIPTETKSSTTTEDAEKKPSSTPDSALPEPPIRPSTDSDSPVAPTEDAEKEPSSIPDVPFPAYRHSDDSLDWFHANILGRTLRMTLLQKGDDPFVFLYQRKFSKLRPVFINYRLVRLGLAEAAPVASPFLIKSDQRKLTSMMLQAEHEAERKAVGMWKDSKPAWRRRLRALLWWPR
eukprot:scpid94203/ scgid31529/ 